MNPVSLAQLGLNDPIPTFSDLSNIVDVIDKKTYIGRKLNISSELSGNYKDLSVLNVDMDYYLWLLQDGQLSNNLSDTVFIVYDNEINAFGQNIKNLNDAIDDDDAVTLGQSRRLINYSFIQGDLVLQNNITVANLYNRTTSIISYPVGPLRINFLKCDSSFVRDCILVIQCGDIAPSIEWMENSYGRTSDEFDLRCSPNMTNVYFITEILPQKFVVSRWEMINN